MAEDNEITKEEWQKVLSDVQELGYGVINEVVEEEEGQDNGRKR